MTQAKFGCVFALERHANFRGDSDRRGVARRNEANEALQVKTGPGVLDYAARGFGRKALTSTGPVHQIGELYFGPPVDDPRQQPTFGFEDDHESNGLK